jgi:Transposase zinc-binding domain
MGCPHERRRESNSPTVQHPMYPRGPPKSVWLVLLIFHRTPTVRIVNRRYRRGRGWSKRYLHVSTTACSRSKAPSTRSADGDAHAVCATAHARGATRARGRGACSRRSVRQEPSATSRRECDARAIEQCRTAVLGGHLDVCTECAYEKPSYNSCRNRHCPKC